MIEQKDRFIVTIPLNINKDNDKYLIQFSKNSNKIYNYFLNEANKRFNLYNLYKKKLYNLIKNKPSEKKIKNKVLNVLKDNFFKGFNNIPNYTDYINDRKKTLGSGYFLDTPNYYITNINVQNLIDDKDWITNNTHISLFNGCKISAYDSNTFQNKTIKNVGSQVVKNLAKSISNKIFQKVKKPSSVGYLKFRKGYEIKSFTNSHNNSNLTFNVNENNYGVLNIGDIEIVTNKPLNEMKNPKIKEIFDIIKNNSNICMCSVKHEIIRNERRWFVDVTLKGKPHFNKIEIIDDNCGLDLGPKNFAIADSKHTEYKSFHNLTKKQEEINHINKLLSNKIPKEVQNSWNQKNKRNFLKYNKSESYKNLLLKKKQIERKFRIASNIEIHKLAKTISPYKNVFMEDVSYKSWQVNFGKSVGIFKPAYFKNKLEQYMSKYNNKMHLINCFAALSQYCICGNKEKKSLSQRMHVCSKCGFTIHRDELSAVLAIHTNPETLKIDFIKAKNHIDNLVNDDIILKPN